MSVKATRACRIVLVSMDPFVVKIMHAFKVSTFETVSYWFKNYKPRKCVLELSILWDIAMFSNYLRDWAEELRAIKGVKNSFKSEKVLTLRVIFLTEKLG